VNANELADELETIERQDWYEWMKDAATMLRQQQAEIEALKKEISMMEKYLKQANDMWVGAMKQIETYEKRMFG